MLTTVFEVFVTGIYYVLYVALTYAEFCAQFGIMGLVLAVASVFLPLFTIIATASR